MLTYKGNAVTHCNVNMPQVLTPFIIYYLLLFSFLIMCILCVNAYLCVCLYLCICICFVTYFVCVDKFALTFLNY